MGAAVLEILASGYGLIEGPRVDPEGLLYFSDVTRGGVYRRVPDGRVEQVVPRRRGVGGIALHADGGIVISGRDIAHVANGRTRTLLERGEGVGGFNDLFTDARGRVLTGTLRANPFEDLADRAPGECLRIESEGIATELYDRVGLSNGIGFSPDGGVLYHADTSAGHVIVHDVAADGSVSNRRVTARTPLGAPDGLAVDSDGGIWVACYGGGCAQRFDAAGRPAGRIEVPARQVTSLCFGGADLCDLVIVTADNTDSPERGGTVFRTRVEIPGLPAPLARI